MKTKLLFVLTLLTFTFVHSQNGRKPIFEISGKVIDEETKAPLEYATIVFTPKNRGNVTGGVTDENGNFIINVPQGNYTITVEFISFKTKSLGLKNITSNLNLGTITLREDGETLDEIEIRAEKTTVEVKLDKKIYNVGKDLTVKGGTASDVLDNIPSVSVDVDGTVNLRGSDNVRILINGRPSGLVGLSSTEALQQFPADAIERVEVITSPSARYDAEGTAGILNIILKRGKVQGFNGSITANAGHPDYFGGNANLNYRTEKFNFFTNLGYTYRNAPGNSSVFQKNIMNNEINSFLSEKKDYDRKRNFANISLGTEYFINDKTSMTGSIFYRNSDGNTFIKNNGKILNADTSLDKQYVRTEDETSDGETFEFNYNFSRNFKKEGHKLTVDFQFDKTIEDNTAEILQQNIFDSENLDLSNEDEKTINNQNEKSYLIQADYVLPLGEVSQFEAGYKSDLENEITDYSLFLRNANGEFEKDLITSNVLDYTENIHSFYSQFGSEFGKFSYLLGLRSEITDIKIKFADDFSGSDNNATKNYTSFFPSVNLGYEFSESLSLSLGYNRRLSRPRSWFLNPFPSRSSETNIFVGNIDLDPVFTNSFETGILKKWKKFTLNSSVYFRRSTDVIQFISTEIGETEDGIPIIQRSPVNLSSRNQYGFEFTSNYSIFKWWRISSDFNFFKFETKGAYEDISFDASNFSWTARLSSKITLFKEIDWQTRLFYRGPSENGQTERKGIFSASLAFSKDVLKDKGTITLNVSDLFNSRKRKSTTTTPTTISENEFQWRERQILLSFTYRFNQKKKQQRGSRGSYDGGGDEGGF
ncbi:outer membrane beta-barrel family protein [Aureivirga sp. CE67]|uniref:outer membrane beta-barrel family protein n=1 Tax=Aureivirga sp. CE67 TaxID=1788983 RepID=UPI0018C9704A|nr:outer membrane beta-barrel family protein [Aureivirga sp. CE67]